MKTKTIGCTFRCEDQHIAQRDVKHISIRVKIKVKLNYESATSGRMYYEDINAAILYTLFSKTFSDYVRSKVK